MKKLLCFVLLLMLIVPQAYADITSCVVCVSSSVYEKPNKTSNVLCEVNADTKVTLLSTNEDWAHISINDIKGYIPLSCVNTDSGSLVTQTVYAAVDELRVYKSPNTKSKLLGTLIKGTELGLIAVNDQWAKIEKDGNTGFVQKKDISEALPIDTQVVETQEVYSLYDDVNVYLKNKTSSKVIGTLEFSQSLKLIASKNKWAKVEHNGQIGFVEIKYLSKTKPVYVYASESPVTVYKEPNDTSKALTDIPANTKLTATKTLNEGLWTEVINGNNTGYIKSEYLSEFAVTLYTPLKPGDTGEDVTRLQERLCELGYLKTGTIGKYLSLTKAAVIKLQQANGLTQTGEASVLTQNILYSQDTLNCLNDLSHMSCAPKEAPKSADWALGEPDTFFAVGGLASVTSTLSGDVARVMRTGGKYYASVQPVSESDGHVLEGFFSDTDSNTLGVVVTCGGENYAASMAKTDLGLGIYFLNSHADDENDQELNHSENIQKALNYFKDENAK